MILQALYQLYQSLEANGKTTPEGMQWKPIPFVITITPEGLYVGIEDTRDKKEAPKGKLFLVAKDKKRTGSKSYETANLLWDHSGYVLNIPTDESERKAELAPLQHEAFLKLVNQLAEQHPQHAGVRAIRAFYAQQEHLKVPRELFTNPKETSPNIVFKLSNTTDANAVIASDTNLVWGELAAEQSAGNEQVGRCLITGEVLPLARLHDTIKLPGGQANPSLISFNLSAFNSYGKEQGSNAPISQKASNAAMAAINVLLDKDAATNYKLGNTTFLFWSTLTYNQVVVEQEQNLRVSLDELMASYKEATFSGLINQEEEEEEAQENPSTTSKTKKKTKKDKADPTAESERVLKALRVMTSAKDGHISWQNQERFYLLGLIPNAKRVCVKLWMEGTVSEIVGNTIQHLKDLNIVSFKNRNPDEERPPLRSVYSLVRAVSTADSADKWSPILVQGIVESIVKGLPYPQSLQMACLDRVHHDGRSKYLVTELRAAILKAYINRKYKQPILAMALDLNNSHPAYVAGRAFALLERIQELAIPGVKANITDRYYRMASATPNMVFGRLFQLAQHHLTKIKRDSGGLGYYFERELGKVVNLLPGGQSALPAHFTPDEQSIFAVAYYHQKNYRDEKAEEKAATKEVAEASES